MGWKDQLEAQMRAWRNDPDWREVAPTIKVSVPKGSFCAMDCTCVLALPPDAVFSTLCAPDNRRVFKNIKSVKSRRVVEDDGQRQVVEVEQAAIWRFLFLSGTFDVCVRVVEDRPKRQITFSLSKPGFMKRFEGWWHVQPMPMPASNEMHATPPDRPSGLSQAALVLQSAPAPFKPSTVIATQSVSASPSPLRAVPSWNAAGRGSPSTRPSTVEENPTGFGAALGGLGELLGIVGGARLGDAEALESHSLFSGLTIRISSIISRSTRAGGSIGDSGSGGVGDSVEFGFDSSGSGGGGASSGGRMASLVSLHQEVLPAVVPPSFLGHYLRGITAQVTRDMLNDFQTEAARMRYDLPEDCDTAAELHRRQQQQRKREKQEREEQRKEGKAEGARSPRSLSKGGDNAPRRRRRCGAGQKAVRHRLSEKEHWRGVAMC